MRLIKASHLKKGFNFTKVQVNGLANYLGMGHYWCLATSTQGCTLGLLLKSIGQANISLDAPLPNLTHESNRQLLLELYEALDLVVGNTFFTQPPSRQVTAYNVGSNPCSALIPANFGHDGALHQINNVGKN